VDDATIEGLLRQPLFRDMVRRQPLRLLPLEAVADILVPLLRRWDPPVSLEDLNDYCRNFMDNRYEETMIQRGVCVYKLLKSATNGRKSHGWAMLFWDQVDLPGTTEGILDWKRSIVASVSLAHNLKLTELYRDFLDPEVPYSLKSFASGMWEPSVRQGSLAYYVLLLPELEEGRLPSKEDEKRLLQQLRSSGLVLREVQGCDGPGGLHRRRGHWVGLR
jgi:hypothetical protein